MEKEKVTELRYRAVGASPFDCPDAVFAENEWGTFVLAQDTLIIRLASPYISIEMARNAVEPFLHAWEFEAELRYGHDAIVFKFDNAKCADGAIQQSLDENNVAHKPEAASGETLQIVMIKYPEPPSIRLTPEILDIWRRFENARFGIREPVQACVYYCLTVVERSAGGRAEAAQKYHIDVSILRKLGELTSIRGKSGTARKALPEMTFPRKKPTRQN